MRGVTIRGMNDGGDEERVLVDEYQRYARAQSLAADRGRREGAQIGRFATTKNFDLNVVSVTSIDLFARGRAVL